MSDAPQQPSGSSSSGQCKDGAPPPRSTGRPLRGIASLRGGPSVRGASTRSASASGTSMVPSRSSYASPAPGALGAAGPAAGTRMQFRPVMPQRRKASESPAPTSSTAAESTAASPLSTPHTLTRSGSRGRGRGGARPPRQSAQMTASGPFALGPSTRAVGKKVVPTGPGGSGLTTAASSDPSASSTAAKVDPDRATYRNPDKLKDAEQYSDPEDGGVEIVDMDEVHFLDDLAPRALPRVAEKESKKDKQKAASARQKKIEGRKLKDEREISGTAVRVKSEDDDDAMGELDLNVAGTADSATLLSASATPQPEDGLQANAADALDLSESEAEEFLDDLVDDFVLHDEDDVNPENRLYLFQFPQLFPKFRPDKANKTDAADALADTEPSSSANTGKRRTVSFAEGTTGGEGPSSVKDEVPSSEIDSDAELSGDEDKKTKPTSSQQHEGLVGKLDVYRDGRVFLRSGELVMEVTGGSQSTFLQQVMLLDPSNRTATSLGELHRKFIVTPELDCMLNDIKLHDDEKRVKEEERKIEDEKKAEAERIKYGGGIASVGGR